MKNHRAFSLIEVSVVILIIGLLVAGMAQGSKLVRNATVNAARTLTKQSVVNSASGLVLWLETTLPESIFVPPDNAQANYDGNSNLWWYDINPQALGRSNGTVSWSVSGTAAQKPTYIEDAINKIPALKGNGYSSVGINSGSVYYPQTIPYVTNSFTVFLVASAASTHQVDVQTNAGTSGTSGQKYVIDANYGGGYGGSSVTSGMGVSMGTNGVSVYEHAINYMPPLAVYDGSSSGLLSKPAIITVDYNNKTPTLYINSNTSVVGVQSTMTTVVAPNRFFANDTYGGFDGYVGEIIVFNRHLRTDERKAVEKYLSKKWKIDL